MSRVRSPSPASTTDRKAQRLPVVFLRASGLFSAESARGQLRQPRPAAPGQQRTPKDREGQKVTLRDTVLCGVVRTTGKVNGEGRSPFRRRQGCRVATASLRVPAGSFLAPRDSAARVAVRSAARAHSVVTAHDFPRFLVVPGTSRAAPGTARSPRGTAFPRFPRHRSPCGTALPFPQGLGGPRSAAPH